MDFETRGAARILLVEDNPADARLVQEALKRADVPVELVIVEDGEQALEFLHARGDYVHAEPPDLVLLDLNLPGIDGRQVLEAVKSDETLRQIPVIVMTTSESDDDIWTCYDLHANGYVTKPTGVGNLSVVIKAIHEFWFEVARLPSRSSPVG